MRHKKIIPLVVVCIIILVVYHNGLQRWMMDAVSLDSRSNAFPLQKTKHTNLVFVKTHKTAGSTMQNLLFRFAQHHNLTVALPAEFCDHKFCYPSLFSHTFVRPNTIPPNIMTSHLRFNMKELQLVMPKDTIYITILREPSFMFESLFNYFLNYCDSFRRVPNHSLETFLADPWQYYRPNEEDSVYARNTMTFDLGKDKDHPPTDAAYVQAFLAEMEQAFSLVMITDYFDESLIVLRHLLSWDLDDLLYFKINSRKEESKQTLTPALASKIRDWNALDTQLYDYFNASLWRKIAALGTAFVAKEVRELQQAQENLMRSCFNGEVQIRSSKEMKNRSLRPWQPVGTAEIMGFDLPLNFSHGLSSHVKELCLKIATPELHYLDILQNFK